MDFWTWALIITAVILWAVWPRKREKHFSIVDPTDPSTPITPRPILGVVYKQVKVKAGNGRRTERVLNKYARQGWTLVEVKKGGLWFGSHDTAILFRPVNR